MKAAIFDFDGTLADTMGFWNNLARNYLLSIGLKPLSNLEKALEKLTVDEGAIYMKEEYKIDKTEIEIKAEMDELLYKYYRKDAQLKADVLEILEELKCRSVRMAIASVIDEDFILAVLKRYKISSYFEFIQTCENVGLNKGDRNFFDLLPERLNLRPDEIYMFEDTLYSIVSAKGVGLKIVGVEDEFAFKDKEKIRELSDIYIRDFSEFIEILKNKF